MKFIYILENLAILFFFLMLVPHVLKIILRAKRAKHMDVGNLPVYIGDFSLFKSKHAALTVGCGINHFLCKSRLFISKDLVSLLTTDELDAVIKHEIIHAEDHHFLKRYFFTSFCIAAGLFSILFSYICIGLWLHKSPTPSMLAIFAFVMGITIPCFLVSRFFCWQERLADYKAVVTLEANPLHLKNAIEKIDMANTLKTFSPKANECLTRSWKIFLTHPPAKERAQYLYAWSKNDFTSTPPLTFQHWILKDLEESFPKSAIPMGLTSITLALLIFIAIHTSPTKQDGNNTARNPASIEKQ